MVGSGVAGDVIWSKITASWDPGQGRDKALATLLIQN